MELNKALRALGWKNALFIVSVVVLGSGAIAYFYSNQWIVGSAYALSLGWCTYRYVGLIREQRQVAIVNERVGADPGPSPAAGATPRGRNARRASKAAGGDEDKQAASADSLQRR
jgi:hypothetical protein